jgi:hypothetical protein
VQVNDGLERESWLAARRGGITASTLAKAMTPAGRRDVLAHYADPELEADSLRFVEDYLQHGKDRENGFIGQWIEEMHGIPWNRGLWAHDDFPRFLATPDGWNPVTRKTAEYKAKTKPLPPTTPRIYRDQVQWQLFVMGGTECLFVWEQHRDFVPVDMPVWRWIERDEERIEELKYVANGLLWEFDLINEEMGVA